MRSGSNSDGQFESGHGLRLLPFLHLSLVSFLFVINLWLRSNDLNVNWKQLTVEISMSFILYVMQKIIALMWYLGDLWAQCLLLAVAIYNEECLAVLSYLNAHFPNTFISE